MIPSRRGRSTRLTAAVAGAMLAAAAIVGVATGAAEEPTGDAESVCPISDAASAAPVPVNIVEVPARSATLAIRLEHYDPAEGGCNMVRSEDTWALAMVNDGQPGVFVENVSFDSDGKGLKIHLSRKSNTKLDVVLMTGDWDLEYVRPDPPEEEE